MLLVPLVPLVLVLLLKLSTATTTFNNGTAAAAVASSMARGTATLSTADLCPDTQANITAVGHVNMLLDIDHTAAASYAALAALASALSHISYG